jgi:hypothetical protein
LTIWLFLQKYNWLPILSWTENIGQVTDLGMSCVGAHYGHLPELFSLMMNTTIQDNFEALKDIYIRSKRMIENKTCATRGLINFIEASVTFLTHCKNHDSSVTTAEECIFLRKTLELSKNSVGEYPKAMGRICMLEGN